MSKEMPILFVYDTLHCQTEHDDPSEAVLYFYPSWVSDQQRLALCGQLMGTTYFLKNVFSCPKIIELKSGKFVMKHFGRYILAVGTDRNIANWILLRRAELLSSLLQFYHCDIQVIKYQIELTAQTPSDSFGRSKLSDKLYQIFESYLSILQHWSNVFQNVPVIRLPKSGSNVFLEAMHTLQFCQHRNNVLGGVILYHNKVVATQLPPSITKYLVLTDPHHIKSSAERLEIGFHLPAETQILIVYIEQEEYKYLKNLSDKAKSLSQTKQLLLNKATANKDVTTITSLKRDKSIIFTSVPEEDVDHSTCAKLEDIDSTKTIFENKTSQKYNQKFSRPTHLPLKYKNVTSRDLPDSGLGIDKTDEDEMIPEFKRQTSVCSTPMTDLNKILHGRAMSICGFPMRTYGFGLSKFKFENNEDACDDSDDSYLKRNRTLSEPCYNNMTSDFILENPIEKLDLEVTKKINKDKPKKEILSKPSPKEVDTSIKFSSVLDKTHCKILYMISHTTDAQDKSSICNTPISSVINSDLNHSEAFGGRVRSHLLICGQRDMTLLLILEDGAGYNEQLITEMWETCVSRLPRLESKLRDILGAVEPEQIPSNNEQGYSFMCVGFSMGCGQSRGTMGSSRIISIGSYAHVCFGYQFGRIEMYYHKQQRSVQEYPHHLMAWVLYK
ncbi:uncharacterized protein LOC113370807 [Ctenocephalides felis]|uniref:uncharacterized protein LOC113370807 n=1 Tax=Ctenocephalides felis TaxID=7515 RepID=UPI000E6E2064|nr:uncharacterized protein LOC113370807 [Ctenocephalides felis]